MESIKERVESLFKRFNVALQVQDPTEVQLLSAKLDSGQEIQTDAEAWAPGAQVFVMNDEGERIPLPDGEYNLESGEKLYVKDGAVAEAEVEEEPMPEEELEQQMESASITEEQVMALVEKAIADLKVDVQTLSAQLQKFAAQPAVDALPRSAKPFAPVDLTGMTMEERIKAIQTQYSHG